MIFKAKLFIYINEINCTRTRRTMWKSNWSKILGSYFWWTWNRSYWFLSWRFWFTIIKN